MTSGSFFKVRDRDDAEILEAKQKASIKWLVSKAYNNKPPREYAEPFYRDHLDKDRLKPHLVHALANGELYCMALSTLYSDPNYHNLNHWAIIQAMSRKGIYVTEPSDCALTETVLIQDSPLRMSAHIAVIEALMSLYVKEMVAPERVDQAVKRFSKKTEEVVPNEAEEILMFWVNLSSKALKDKFDGSDISSQLSLINRLQDISDFSDGVGLTAVTSFYCPDDLPVTEIALGDPPSMTDSLCNIQQFQRFCQDALPYNICHLTLEDIFYMHNSIKLGLQCLLVDLFMVLEVKPAKCVQLPGAHKERIIEVPDPSERGKSPGYKSNGLSFNVRSDSRTDTSGDEGFVVKKGRTVPTLSSVSHSHRSISPGSDLGQKERLNQDTKSEERGETETPSVTRSNSIYESQRGPAGAPSEKHTPRSYAGRRSRRNSTSDNQSQISLENIGGSTENLCVLGRNPDKEMRVHSGKKSDNATSTLRRGSANHQTFDIRKPSDESKHDNDVKMFIDNKELDAMEKYEREGSPYGGKSASQHVNISDNKEEDRERKTSFADLRKKSQIQNQFVSSGINITYSGEADEKEDQAKRYSSMRRESESTGGSSARSWANPQTPLSNAGNPAPTDEMNDKLNSVRMKLEERRRRIEEEKRKMEVVMSKQKEKTDPQPGPVSALGSNWLSERPRQPSVSSQPTDPYTRSYNNMNDSIYELQSDLHKLASQQSQIQNMMQSPQNTQNAGQSQYASPANAMDPQPFYISGSGQQQHPQMQQPQQQTPQRRTWGQPQPINFGAPPGWNNSMGGPQNQGPAMYGNRNPYPQFDQYGNPIIPRDQWGNPIPQQPSMYNGPQQTFDQWGNPQPYGQPQQFQSPGQYQGQPQFSPQQFNPGYGGQNPPTYSNAVPPSSNPQQQRGTPFRLHDYPPTSHNSSYLETSPPTDLPQSLANTSTPRQQHSYSRQSSREQLQGSGPSTENISAAQSPVRRLHAPVPAPAADDMAPQNVSFIQDSTDNDEDDKSMSPLPSVAGSGNLSEHRSDSNLSERLAKLNISRGDKTYRVQLHADGRDPTSVESQKAFSPPRNPPTPRATISSSFKEKRRSSGEGSGPGSMSGPGSFGQNTTAVQTKLTDEELDALNTMKTEVLKETGDPAKGFVISFDDDQPKKPKPVLKQRRMSKKISKEEPKPSDPVMIMLDMNEDGDSEREISPIRKMSAGNRMNSINGRDTNGLGSPSRYVDPSQWNSYGHEGSLTSPDEPVIPRFDVDPGVPLEPMRAINDTSSDSDGTRLNNPALLIGDELVSNNEEQSDMAKKKERILMQSMKRKQQAEENKHKREDMARKKKEEEAMKAEEALQKKEEEKKRKEAILEAFKLKKEMDKAEEEGRHFPAPVSAKPVPKIRGAGPKRQRPKTIHVDKKGSISNLSNIGSSNHDLRRSESRGSLAESERPSSRSTLSLAAMGRRPPTSNTNTNTYGRPQSRGPPPTSSRRGSTAHLNEETDSPRSSRPDRSGRSISQPRGKRDSSVSSAYGAVDRGQPRNDSFRSSRESLTSRRTYTARRGSNASLYDDDDDYNYGGSLRDVSYGGHTGRRKSSSANYLGPGSLPSRQRGVQQHMDYDDGASDISSQASGWSAYGYRSSGGRMQREPAAKSNRPIVMNAFEHAVFPGAVNKETRMRVLEEIDACDCPHFLILFRDGKCQFRGLYAYYPDTEEVFKIYGTGPKIVSSNMFEKYFKYNSGGKKFTPIHTKSLSVTIDAFTIHSSLWLGKKAKLPDRRDMTLVV